MKTPRVKDFDPNAKEEPLLKELKSSLDNMPTIQKPNAIINKTEPRPVPPYLVPSPGTAVPYGVSRPVPPIKRRMKQRQPFDIYEDQYDSLKTIAEEERAQGLPGSMSRMVREGIDMYLKERTKGEK